MKHPYYTMTYPDYIPTRNNYGKTSHMPKDYGIILPVTLKYCNYECQNILRMEMVCRHMTDHSVNINIFIGTNDEKIHYITTVDRDEFGVVDKYLYETIRDSRAALNAEILRATNRAT